MRPSETAATELLFPRFIVLEQAFDHAIGVFAENARLLFAVDVAHPVVVAGLNTSENLLAVHDVWLEINGWTFVKTRRHQIPRKNVATRSHL